jgi:hypothetical protein
VRLEHPNAPVERRTIELTPGETLLLDVTLKVTAPKLSASAAALAKARTTGAPLNAQNANDAQDAGDSGTP